MARRIAHGVQAALAGEPVAVFPGGEASHKDASHEPIGGGIIGRDTFARPKEQGADMLNKIIDTCLGNA